MISLERFFHRYSKKAALHRSVGSLEIRDYLPNVHIVEPTELIITKDKKPFVSTNFVTCSGYILRSSDGQKDGLLHLAPLQYLDQDLRERLMEFKNGEVIEIRGPRSKPRLEIIKWLQENLKVEDIKKIKLTSSQSSDGNITIGEDIFSLIYNPNSNEITLLRWNHQPALYTGFSDKHTSELII
jgi:hypothetical protein